MGRFILAGLAAIFLLSVHLEAKECIPTEPATPPEEYDDYDDHFVLPPDNQYFDEFDWHLSRLLHQKEPGNVIMSPIGIKVLLAILYEGAQGKTAAELREVLRISSNRTVVRLQFEHIIKSLQDCQPDYSLELGTQVFASKEVSLYKGFSRKLRLFYDANYQYIDFLNADEAASIVNHWVSNSTHGRIPSLLNPNDVQQNTVLMLLNAIFFLGSWKYPFAEQNSKEDLFYVSPTKAVNVTYMTQDHYLYYSESVEMDAKILRLPYRGKKYSMFLILPKKPDGLPHLVNTINPDLLRKHMSTMEQSSINVMIPRFKFDYTVDLGEALREMGLNDIFDERANLPGLLPKRIRKQNDTDEKPSLYVSKVMQRAGIEVNENGTVAYGATSMTIENKFGGQDYSFRATHPFIFFIEDETTGIAVFVGKVIDPSALPS